MVHRTQAITDVPLISIYALYEEKYSLSIGDRSVIKNCNDDFLRTKGIDEKYILLYQVWKELTEPKTLDSYQYRIMNTLSGIRELTLVINQRLNSYVNSNRNIDACKIELKRIICQDDTLKKHYPVIWNRLLKHLNDKTDIESKQRALRYQLDYCYSEIGIDYFRYLVEDLQSAIDNMENEQIIIMTGQLVSCCVTLGWSTQALNGLIDNLKNSKNNSTRWDDFKNKILGASSNAYTVYIPIKISPKPMPHMTKNNLRENFHKQLVEMGIWVKSNEEMKIVTENLNIDSFPIEKRYYMSVVVSAFDFYSASHIAIGKCSDVMSLLSFFNSIEAWDARELTWLVVNDNTMQSKKISYSELYGTYDYLEGAYKLLSAAKNILSRDSTIQRKLRAAFSYANMGKASSTQEEKFINTWVALESLCRGDVYDNIIENVLETVPPALCCRYIYQLFRNFIEDCNRCKVEFVFSSGTLWDSRTAKDEQVKSIIRVFNDPAKYEELQGMCSVNTLLRYRCESLHDLMVKDNKLLEKIEQHYLNVRLQLSRLYRIRNEIAHDAFGTEGSLILYIEHLDDYLAGVVAEIIMCSQNKNIDNVELVFEMIKDNYMEFIDIKNAKKSVNPRTLLKSVFETGIINLI